MRLRRFGRTPLQLSEVGFGAWAIGGRSFGRVEEAASLAALARAEELGCNFVDTAAVYGDSESILGRFLPGRRDRWVVATKYSGQPAGLAATVEEQLQRLRVDHIDLYQLHSTPQGDARRLWDELVALRESGRIRHIGVSLYSEGEIDEALANPVLDGFQVCFGLLDPLPFLGRIDAIRARQPGVIARSVLKDGFLTGRYGQASRFVDPHDRRSEWDRGRIARTSRQVDAMRFLARTDRTLHAAAVRYPLSFPEVSTVILSTKSVEQAAGNFLVAPDGGLTASELAEVHEVQSGLGLLSTGWRQRAVEFVQRAVRQVRGA